MYQYSRAIFLAVKDLVDESQPGVSRVEAQRRVLAACEAAVERLAADPRYFARPTRSLFEEIRRYFPITQQARVYVAVDEVISRVVEAASAAAICWAVAARSRARANRASAARCPRASTARRTRISTSASRPASSPRRFAAHSSGNSSCASRASLPT
jgi:hypothetical protein